MAHMYILHIDILIYLAIRYQAEARVMHVYVMLHRERVATYSYSVADT